jgi:mono/diheme cytochrome c family protein
VRFLYQFFGTSSAALLCAALLLAGCGGGASPEGGTPEARQLAMGQRVYRQQCVTCHQAGGRGIDGIYPTLHQTKWTEGDAGRLIRLVLHGMEGPLQIKGASYDQRMQPLPYLTDEQVAAVLTYVRQDFGNNAPAVSPEEVAAVRAATSEREGPWNPDVLWEATGIPAVEAPPADSAAAVAE